MKLEMIRYDTMNSWNGSRAPAFNLKVYYVIPQEYRDKVYELMECDGFYDDINFLMMEFAQTHNYLWQAGFNGRSGGYLVLYRGGRKATHKSVCTVCGQRNYKTIEESGKLCGRCRQETRINKIGYTIHTFPGQNIPTENVPRDVLESFTRLAESIVQTTINMATSCEVEEETYTVEKTRKVIIPK
jgi:hypothetical protein